MSFQDNTLNISRRLRIQTRFTTALMILMLTAAVLSACSPDKICDEDGRATTRKELAAGTPDNTAHKFLRKDPIFRQPPLRTPLLFAHRGGVLEAPESTLCAFRHAVETAKADVLELDVQLTKDGKFVVWHGPGLDNVVIEGIPTDPAKRPDDKKNIGDFEWSELAGKAWVQPPPGDNADLVQCDREDRALLLLSDLLRAFPNIALNIEMKGSFRRKINNNGLEDNIRAFLRVLDLDSGRRTIVVVSAQHKIIKEFRRQSRERYPTNLSPLEQIYLRFSNECLPNRVLETPYGKTFAPRSIIEKVQRLGGSTYVFLTRFGPVQAIDNRPSIDRQQIFEILDRGVDGIMTDRPAAMRKIMDEWVQSALHGNRPKNSPAK